MTVHRQTPTCMFCGKPNAKAVYDTTKPKDFIGDTFLRWEPLAHTCPEKEEWENDHPKTDISTFIKRKQQELKKALKTSVFIPLPPPTFPSPPPPDPPEPTGRLSKTQIEEVEGGIKVIRLPKGHRISYVATGTLNYQEEGPKTIYFVLHSPWKALDDDWTLLIGKAGSLRKTEIKEVMTNTDSGTVSILYVYNDKAGNLYLRAPFSDLGPGNSNSHPDLPLLKHGTLRMLEIPGKDRRLARKNTTSNH